MNIEKRQGLIYISAFLSLSGIFIGLAAKNGYFYPLDLTLSHLIQAWQPSWFVLLMQFISLFEFGMVFIVLPVFFYLRRKGEKRAALFLLFAGLSWFVMRILKLTFNIPCPTADEVKELYVFHNLSNIIHQRYPHGFLNTKVCYPSGHVFDYVVLWGALISLRKKIFHQKWLQDILKWWGILLLLTVGISRISLGAHFFSDVVGGYLLGTAWLLVLRVFFSNGW